jgi:hypothetical protein
MFRHDLQDREELNAVTPNAAIGAQTMPTNNPAHPVKN